MNSFMNENWPEYFGYVGIVTHPFAIGPMVIFFVDFADLPS